MLCGWSMDPGGGLACLGVLGVAAWKGRPSKNVVSV